MSTTFNQVNAILSDGAPAKALVYIADSLVAEGAWEDVKITAGEVLRECGGTVRYYRNHSNDELLHMRGPFHLTVTPDEA